MWVGFCCLLPYGQYAHELKVCLVIIFMLGILCLNSFLQLTFGEPCLTCVKHNLLETYVLFSQKQVMISSCCVIFWICFKAYNIFMSVCWFEIFQIHVQPIISNWRITKWSSSTRLETRVDSIVSFICKLISYLDNYTYIASEKYFIGSLYV